MYFYYNRKNTHVHSCTCSTCAPARLRQETLRRMAELKALEEFQQLQIHLKKLRELKQLQVEMDSLRELKSRVPTLHGLHGKHLESKQPLLGSGSLVEFKYILLSKRVLISELLWEVFLISLKYMCVHVILYYQSFCMVSIMYASNVFPL